MKFSIFAGLCIIFFIIGLTLLIVYSKTEDDEDKKKKSKELLPMNIIFMILGVVGTIIFLYLEFKDNSREESGREKGEIHNLAYMQSLYHNYSYNDDSPIREINFNKYVLE